MRSRPTSTSHLSRARAIFTAAFSAVIAGSATANAQAPAPPGAAQPPPGAAQPLPGAAQPPPGAAQPPTAPPPGAAAQPAYPYPYPYPYGGYQPYPYPYPYGYPPPGYGPPQGYPGLPPPKIIKYNEGDPIPQGYHLETRARKAYLVAGGSVFLGAWAISALTAGTVVSEDSNTGLEPLFIPVVGPFITIGTADLSWKRDEERFGIVSLMLDGLAQTAGVALFVAGLVGSESVLVVDGKTATAKPTLLVGPSSAGLRWTL